MAWHQRSYIRPRPSIGWVIALAGLLAFSMSASIPKQGTMPLFACKSKTPTVLNQNLHLFILVDESASAIAKDRTGEIRSAMLHTIVEFAVGYGWLADAPPYLRVYKYSTAYKDNGNTELVYPAGVFNFPVMINDLEKTLKSIDIKLDITKIEPLAENLPATFAYIGKEIEDIPDGDKALVVLITQGVLVEKHSLVTQIDALLAVSNITTSLKAQTGIFMFEDDGTFDEWKSYFTPAKNAPEVYFHTCCNVTGPNTIELDRNVWDGMLTIYGEEGLFNGHVSTGIIPIFYGSGVFSPDIESLYAVSLKWPQEAIIINDSKGTNVTSTIPNLLKFEFDHPTKGNTWSSKSVSSVQILYTCKSASISTPTPIPTPTPDTTQTPPPICPPDCPPPITLITPGGLISIGIALLIYLLMKDSPNFYISMSWILFISDVTFISYFLSSAIVWHIIENVYTGIVSELIAGVILSSWFFVKKHEERDANPDRSKFEDLIVIRPAFFWAMLFPILSSTWINSLFH